MTYTAGFTIFPKSTNLDYTKLQQIRSAVARFERESATVFDSIQDVQLYIQNLVESCNCTYGVDGITVGASKELIVKITLDPFSSSPIWIKLTFEPHLLEVLQADADYLIKSLN